ncbi:hypothetical protein BB8028_0001g02100 [Beauveria bassiana]|uniref:Uncharacterized protein n=2 Tax=Beauveria bassiana TaxID=176275 RepID=A0A0A2VVK0_BEABA|nr:hypothetical protein BBAD15_g9981 [Beauveria bassiana D1-5]PQK08131.1 hypothetical protein BB8028_0001g02100 [Beauveria bassiana]
MYIPRGLSEADESPRAVEAVGGGIVVVARLDKRQFSDDPLQNTNTSIGVIVGVVLAVFLAGVFAFLWVYRDAVRCSGGGRKRRRSSSSKSTKSSKSSKAASDHDGEAEPAPEAPAAGAPAAGEAPA